MSAIAFAEPSQDPFTPPPAASPAPDLGVDALPGAPRWADAGAPPVPAPVAGELYGHLTETVAAGTPAEIDANVAARKTAVEQDMQAQAAAVVSQGETEQSQAETTVSQVADKQKQAAPPPAAAPDAAPVAKVEAKPEAPTKESLASELDATLAKEEKDLEDSRVKALADIDGRITAERARMDAGVLGADATTAAEGQLGAQAGAHDRAVSDHTATANAGRAERVAQVAAARQARAREAAAQIEAAAEGSAIGAEAVGRANATLINAQMGAALVQAQAQVQAEADGVGNPMGAAIVMTKAVGKAAQIRSDYAARATNAINAGKTEATRIRAEAARRAAETRKGGASKAAEEGGTRQEVADGPTVDEARQGGTDKMRASAEDARGKQREKESATLADLQKQRDALVTRLDAQIAAQRASIQTRIASMKKQVAAANPAALGQLAANVKAASTQIDRTSDQIDDSAKQQIDMVGRQIKAKTDQTLATMANQAKDAMAKIEAEAATARAAIARAGHAELTNASDAAAAADAAMERDAEQAANDQQKKIDEHLADIGEMGVKGIENVVLAGMTPAERKVQREQNAALAQLKVPPSGNPQADGARMAAALSHLSTEKRAEAIAAMPEAQQALAREMAQYADGASALRGCVGEDGKVDLDSVHALMLGKSLAERNAILAASGVAGKLGKDVTGLTSDEAVAATAKILANKDKPEVIAAAFAGMTPAQQAQVSATYETHFGTKLEAEVNPDLLPADALSKEAQTKRQNDGNGAQMILNARTGNLETDRALTANGLALLSPEKRAELIRSLPPEMAQVGKDMLAAQVAGDELKADPAKAEEMLAGKSLAERNAIVAASGMKDELDGKYTKLSADEAGAAVAALQATKDPRKIKAAFAGMTDEQRQQVGDEYERLTGEKLEEALPAGALPNAVLSPAALADQLTNAAKDAKRGLPDAAVADWVSSLPADKRDEAIAALPDEQRQSARRAVLASTEGEKLRAAAKDPAAIDQILAGKTFAERNAIIAAAGVAVGDKHAKMSDDEVMAAVEALKAAGDDPVASRLAFGGLPPAEQAKLAKEYEAATGSKIQDVVPPEGIPAGALTMTDLMGLPAAERGELMAGMTPSDRTQAQLMVEHEKDGNDLKAALESDPVDSSAVEMVMAGRTPAERRAIIAASGAEDKLPNARQYTEITEEEKEAAAVALQCAGIGGDIDQIAIDETMAGLMPDQQSVVAREFRDQTGQRIGEKFPGNVLPAGLREKPVDPKTAKDASTALFKAMDGSGTDENMILNTLRGKSPAEVRAILKEYADAHPGHDLLDDIKEDMDPDSPEGRAALAMLSDDPVAAAVASLEYGRKGGGTDEQLIKDTLAGIADPEDRKRVAEAWHEAHPDESLDEMLRYEMDADGTDYQEAAALKDGDVMRARAVRLWDAMEGSGTNEQKLNEQLEACPDEKSRRALRKVFAEVAFANGEDADECDLDSQLEDELGDEDLDVANHFAKGELAEAYASKLKIAGDGSGTDEDPFFTTFENPPPGWRGSPEAWRKAVTKGYDSQYAKDGENSLAEEAREELTDLDYERFTQTRDKGKMDPMFALRYATEGSGTKDEILSKIMHDKDGKPLPKEVLDKMRADWAKYEHNDDTSLDDLLVDETSGRLDFEMRQALKGQPTTPAERLERMREKQEFETSGLLSGMTNVFTQSDECMDAQLELAQKAYDLSQDPNASDEDRKKAADDLVLRSDFLDTNIGEHKHAEDQIVSRMSQLASYAMMTIPGGALVAWQGALATKVAMKGAKLSGEEIASEAGIGAVTSAVTAAITIGTAGAGAGIAPTFMQSITAAKGAMQTLQVIGRAGFEFGKGALKELATGTLQNLAGELLHPDVLSGKRDMGDVVGNLALSGGIGFLGASAGTLLKELGPEGFKVLTGMIAGIGESAVQTVGGAAIKGEAIDPFSLIGGMATGGYNGALKGFEAPKVPAAKGANRSVDDLLKDFKVTELDPNEVNKTLQDTIDNYDPDAPRKIAPPADQPEIDVAPASVGTRNDVHALDDNDAEIKRIFDQGYEGTRRSLDGDVNAEAEGTPGATGTSRKLPMADAGDPEIEVRTPDLDEKTELAKATVAVATTELAETKTGREALKKLQDSGAGIEVGKPGGGTYYDLAKNKVVIDPSNNPDANDILPHELHHAATLAEIIKTSRSPDELAQRMAMNEAESETQRILNSREREGAADSDARRTADLKEVQDRLAANARKELPTATDDQIRAAVNRDIRDNGSKLPPEIVFQAAYADEMKWAQIEGLGPDAAHARAVAKGTESLAQSWGDRKGSIKRENGEGRAYKETWKKMFASANGGLNAETLNGELDGLDVDTHTPTPVTPQLHPEAPLEDGAPAPLSPEGQKASNAAKGLYNLGKALEKEKNPFFGEEGEPELVYKHATMDLNSIESSMREFAEGSTSSLNGKCSVTCDVWQKRMAEKGVYVPINNYNGHRWMAQGDVIIDPTFGQFFGGPMTQLPGGHTQFEPFVGTYQEMVGRVQQAIDAGLMPDVAPGTDPAEVLKSNWGIEKPSSKGGGVKLADGVEPFTGSVAPPPGYRHPAERGALDHYAE